MDRDELNDLLAGYLGSELGPDERRQFEDYVAVDPAFAQEVTEMRRVLGALRALDEPAFTPLAHARLRSGLRPPRWTSALRYAAVIALAFGSGYAARSLYRDQTSPPALSAPQPQQPGNSAGFERRFAEAYEKSAAGSELGRSLIALGRATQQ